MYRTSERTSLSRKMAELEDRWRKSQEDRYMLELKFKEVLKGLANKNEGAKLLRIREKYHRFLENEDHRNQRNDQILRTLDKIESQANILAAKTERLRLLKLHYEAYMRRMYPTWKISEDEEEYLPSKKKEVFYPSHKQRREVMSPNSRKRGENVSKKLTYHSSPYVNKSPYSCNNVVEERKPSFLPSSNECSPDNPSRQTGGENSRLLDLNREFSNINIDSTRKNGDSQDLSVEQEENTSKDLLNLSLTDDNPVNEGAIPEKGRIADEKSRNRSKSSSPKNARVKEEAHRENSCANGNPETFMDKHDSNSLAFDRGSASNKELADVDEDKDADIDEQSDIKRFDVSSKKGSSRRKFMKEDAEKVKPSVVITEPTPDIGLSSSEEEFERRGSKPSPISRNVEQRSLTHPAISEAEVSEGERLGSEPNGVKEKVGYSPDDEQSPFLGGNVEGPYHFSSSDADYDELENQMAAMVERRGNDENIPKVSDDIECESKSVVDGQDPEQQKSYSPSKKDENNVDVEERKDEICEDVVMDEGRLGRNVEFSKIHENVEESAHGNKEGYIEQKEEENANLMKTGDGKIKSYESERDFEAGSSSMDVNSEILDEDHNVNADGGTYHVEESIKEVNESWNSDVAEENSPAHAEGQRAQDVVEYQIENDETDVNHPKEQEQEEMHEYEDVAERDYGDSQQVREEEHFSHDNYPEGRDEEKGNVPIQSDDQQNYGNPEYFHERDEAQNEGFNNEDNIRETQMENVERENLEEADEDEYNAGVAQQELQEQEEWGADELKNEQVNREENVGSHPEEEREEEYEREYVKQEDDDGEYERQDGEQVIENRGHYETGEEDDYQGEAVGESEFDKQDEPHHEVEYNRQDVEDENVYERQDYEVNEEEREKFQKGDEQINMEEVEGNIAPAQEEYERYETEEQVMETPERLAVSEELEEPINYDAADERQDERYDGNVAEQGQYEGEVEEQEYVRHETVNEESNQYHHEEENKERQETQPDVEEEYPSRNVEDQRAVDEVTAENTGLEGDEYLKREHEVTEIYEEQRENVQSYDKNVEESPEVVIEDHRNEIVETQNLSPENMEHRQEVVTPESNISDNTETENQSHEDILSEVVSHEKEVEEIPPVEEEKAVVEVKEEAKVVVKEVKKENVHRKEKKENAAKEHEAGAASSLSVEKHERTTKDSAPANTRQSARQQGKKEYDPHKVEKLKSTIRKFQLKKDNKPDKTGRKGTDSKK